MGGERAELIDEELAAFLRGPVAAFLGSADAMGVPDATRLAGVAAVDNRTIRALVSTDATATRANSAAPGSAVSLLVTDVTTYRSVQWKGTVASWHERTPGDLALMRSHLEAFTQVCPEIGVDPVLAGPALSPVDIVAVVIVVEALYDQTPGSGAGRRIEVSS